MNRSNMINPACKQGVEFFVSLPEINGYRWAEKKEDKFGGYHRFIKKVGNAFKEVILFNSDIDDEEYFKQALKFELSRKDEI